jgi:hypothetical protein
MISFLFYGFAAFFVFLGLGMAAGLLYGLVRGAPMLIRAVLFCIMAPIRGARDGWNRPTPRAPHP